MYNKKYKQNFFRRMFKGISQMAIYQAAACEKN
jgi:hypothetical protein